MSNVFLEIILIIVLIILNGCFSLSEIALLSVKKSRLKYLSQQGDKRAQNALLLTRKSPEMLSTIQIGITAIGIFAGAFGGATIAEYIEGSLVQFSSIAAYGEPISVVLVVIVITYVSVIIGELVPKQLALSNPEALSLKVAGFIKTIMNMAAPLVKLLSASSALLLTLLRVKPASEQIVTEEEIKLLIAEGTENGVFERAEQKMVERIFYLGNRPIKDFMTPRQEVVWLDINDPIAVIRKKIAGSDRSVFPVSNGNINNNIGAIEIKDVLTHVFDRGLEHIELRSLVQPVLRIESDVPSLVAIERLKRSSISIVLITEKITNKIVGIVSFHDILEAIVGEFYNELYHDRG
ncbi:HlyC/CorC family transporter [Candidatus Uhrbacteria bacterium]|nr:HlyC/CorC family transporter [Candidatus Uhrbacteria bacterium]